MRALVLASLMCCLATLAQAGEGLSCLSADGAEIAVPLGGGPGLNPLDTTISVGNRHWSMRPLEGATPIMVAQSFGEDERFMIDYADADFNETIAKLRLFRANNGDSIFAGTLWIKDVGAFMLTCL